ncbi:ParB/RepB/Spo0J family partition protein [Streptomyces sp. 24-1644]|uniref:ParB/RepB/Spo0J family partition protein n=1 Tax=Streptomyces sp. 24-1644 TaxID=3457315 RepID=UPI003FA7B6BD
MAAKKPWADLLDGPGKTGKKGVATAEQPAQPASPPTTVYMHTVIGSPDNPRTELDYSDDDADFRELKKSMQSVGQLQPAVAMSSEAFRRAKPEHAAAVEGAEWVIVLGNRRLHAARQLGWTKFDIRVRDRLGNEDDDKVDEAVIIENIHRKNIPPYKEAEFLQRMVDRHGSQEKVAERIGKSQMYVSNRLALLNLTPELRDVVDTKQIKVKTAEQISRIKDPEEQKARAAQEILKSSQPRPARRKAEVAPEGRPVQNPVLKSGLANAENHDDEAGPGEADQGTLTQSGAVPEPRPSGAANTDRPERSHLQAAISSLELPWHDGGALMEQAFQRLDPVQRSAFILRYFQISRGVDAVIEDMKGTLNTHARASLATILQQVSEGLLKDA